MVVEIREAEVLVVQLDEPAAEICAERHPGGCAAGGNCIPIAVDYPNARVVGVDLSAKQIGDGRRVVEALRLANIELRNASIMDIDASYGLFDYTAIGLPLSLISLALKSRTIVIIRRAVFLAGLSSDARLLAGLPRP